MGDFKELISLLEKSGGAAACPLSDALIARILADEEPICGKAAVYAIIIIIIIITIIIDQKSIAVTVVKHSQ